MEFYRNESFVCHIRYGFVGVAHFQIKNLTSLRRRRSLRLTGESPIKNLNK